MFLKRHIKAITRINPDHAHRLAEKAYLADYDRAIKASLRRAVPEIQIQKMLNEGRGYWYLMNRAEQARQVRWNVRNG